MWIKWRKIQTKHMMHLSLFLWINVERSSFILRINTWDFYFIISLISYWLYYFYVVALSSYLLYSILPYILHELQHVSIRKYTNTICIYYKH